MAFCLGYVDFAISIFPDRRPSPSAGQRSPQRHHRPSPTITSSDHDLALGATPTPILPAPTDIPAADDLPCGQLDPSKTQDRPVSSPHPEPGGHPPCQSTGTHRPGERCRSWLWITGAVVDNPRGATRRHNIWALCSIEALCIVIASWFDRRAMVVVVRGNPVGVRDCPAAVNGNERRHEALDASLGSDGQ
jgi:hypothetical protein